VAGPVLVAAGIALLARPGTVGGYWSGFFPALVVMGLGMALTVAPLTTTVMNAVEVAHAGLASGVSNAVTRTAGLLALAVISVPLLHVFDGQLERRLAGQGLRRATIAEVRSQRLMLGGLKPPDHVSPDERRAIERAIALAFVAAFRLVAWTAAGLALSAAALAAATMRESKP
jgi:hypothetical protein